MTYAELRAKDPAIIAIRLYAASRNLQKIDLDAMWKILCEGADGRYLQEVEPEYLKSLSENQASEQAG